MRTTTVLELMHQEGDWWWCLNVDQPAVEIKGDKWNYKTKATAIRAAAAVARRFGLRIKSISVKGIAFGVYPKSRRKLAARSGNKEDRCENT